MEFDDLTRIITSFADDQSDVISGKGEILATVRGENIVVKVTKKDGDLLVHENGQTEKAIYWIMNRIANLPQLATRIFDYTPSQDAFVVPNGELLEDIELDPTETPKPVEDLLTTLSTKLDTPIPNASNVVYLTSDAGDGKTTVINELARRQAEKFNKKETSWLLIPIPLGGRPFLRFDDIVIASLVNRLRFRLFYYESFIELIKLGLIVPAFDGFEEMFLESSSGEALSATGNLMSKLQSSGTVLIAARKAYFDYKSFSSQAKLFDSIGNNSVSFSKVSISRWQKKQFLEYARARNVEKADELYDFLLKKLNHDWHPLIARPVIVNQLLEVLRNQNDLKFLSESLKSTNTYFPTFVDAIIKREAETKWIDRTGEPYRAMLSVNQHYQILSLVAEEMWLNNTDSLQESVLDLIAEMYCDSQNLSATISKQVKEKLKLHALIIKSDGLNQYKFDHEEFKEFFLGIAFVGKFRTKNLIELKNLMRKGVVQATTSDTIIAKLKENENEIYEYVKNLQEIQIGEGPTSFVRENNGQIIIKLINNETLDYISIENCVFPTNSLHGVILKNLSVKNSYFQSTSLSESVITDSIFEGCTFDKIEYDTKKCIISNTIICDCQIISLYNKDQDYDYYAPSDIEDKLKFLNFDIKPINKNTEPNKISQKDKEDLELIDKALRKFLRSTFISDNIFKMRLGPKADYFFRTLYPILEKNGIVGEENHSGGSKAKQVFKLKIPFDKINYALIKSEGDLEKFIAICKTK